MFLHIDMDYFFAQIEERRHPEYIDKVVVVCVYSKKIGDSGVVSTVNYRGRKFGIHSGQPIARAKAKAPQDSIFLPVDLEYYRKESEEIRDIVNKYGQGTQVSIDEWLLEVLEIPEETARAIKSEILEKKGYSCSIGVAPSAIGAKMGSDHSKPDGLLLLDELKEAEFISNSKIKKVIGIGNKTAQILNEMGVISVKDLLDKDPVELVEKFGKKTGSFLINLAKGNFNNLMDYSPKEQAEISRIATLEHPTRDENTLLMKLKTLEIDNKDWIKNNKKMYKTLTITFVCDDMDQKSKSLSFRNPKNWNEENDGSIKMLVRQYLEHDQRNIRRIGIKYSNFSDISTQKTLSDEFENLLDF
jgi:DNA polymerase IV (DinB-like DNA polymerase)